MQVKHIFTGFQFVPKAPKRKKANVIGQKKSKLVYAICDKINNEYYAILNTKDDNLKKLPFTKKSYNLKNRLIVFTKTLDKNKKPICVYRSEQIARHSPGTPMQFTPFCKNYIYSGYIVKLDGTYYFDMHECKGAYSNNAALVSDKIRIYED